jgi:hypothetical protein
MSALRIISFNPLVANHSRIISICSEFNEKHIIALPGTGKKHNKQGDAYSFRKCGKFSCFEWGWAAKQAGINKSCGLCLLVSRKVLPNTCINHVYSPPMSLQGRVGAVRYKTPKLDICIVVMYLAPSLNNTLSVINKKVLAWVQDLMSKRGHRVAFVICTDANSKLGKINQKFLSGPMLDLPNLILKPRMELPSGNSWLTLI